VVSEAFGVFVSPNGNDSNSAAAMAMPVKTLGHAIDLAVAAHKRVYACGSAGSYPESVVVGGARDGVSVYGGLDCTTAPASWTYAVGSPALVTPAAPGYALQVTGLSKGVTFEDFAFQARDAAGAGASSIGVWVASSQNVSFRRVSMAAGNAGAAGSAGASGSNHDTQPLDGKSATDASGAANKTCTCPDGSSSTGGQGGGATQTPSSGQPNYGGGVGGANGMACSSAGAAGGDGSDAPAGTADTPSASHGILSAAGWSPAGGVAGSNGKPGQGGGGGGNGRLSAGGGGGGACGGCGGGGAAPGAGGGSSVALLSYQSSVALVGCTLTAKNATDGGKGGDGEQGQGPGGGGLGFGIAPGNGCSGGAGGAGAGGNGAQGGAGGMSLGIGYTGMAPSVDGATMITVGSRGNGGGAGLPGPAAGSLFGRPGAAGVKGPDGVAQAAPLAL
jgi:hypothetical protein